MSASLWANRPLELLATTSSVSEDVSLIVSINRHWIAFSMDGEGDQQTSSAFLGRIVDDVIDLR